MGELELEGKSTSSSKSGLRRQVQDERLKEGNKLARELRCNECTMEGNQLIREDRCNVNDPPRSSI